jgi:hypothetical protein
VLVTRLAIVAAAIVLAGPVQTRTAVPSVRFHHFHFRAGDPAAAIDFGAEALSGTRVLMRGLGPGVRVGRGYAIFDRLGTGEVDAAARTTAPAAAYRMATQWLRAHGVDVVDEDAGSRTSLAAAFQTEVLDHVGFTATYTRAAITALGVHGAHPLRQSDDAAVFSLADTAMGVSPEQSSRPALVEIVRDRDRPDAFWCPMHPDVRGADRGQCPLCGMALVPIPSGRVGEYRMDVALSPGAPGIGTSGLRVTVRDPSTDRPVSALVAVHEKLLHLFIVDRRLEYFRHLHPELRGDGVFEVKHDLPPGEYVLIADFLPQGERAQTLQRAILTPGYRGRIFSERPLLAADDGAGKIAAGVRVRLEASGLKAGREASLRLTLTDPATGAAITDVEPFLGAPGHMLLVNSDLTEANHVHPEGAAAAGPSITFQPRMPAAGLYKLWFQFQRQGVIVTVPFVVSVSPP